MDRKKEEFKGLGYGPGVDPIPEADNGTASTDMLEDVVDEMLNDPVENDQANDQAQQPNNMRNTDK